MEAIAGRVGYSSEYAFSKAFKRELSLAPAHYRRQQRHPDRAMPEGVSPVASAYGSCLIERSVGDGSRRSHMMTSAESVRPLEQLTDREREVLGLIAEGKTNGAIAAVGSDREDRLAHPQHLPEARAPGHRPGPPPGVRRPHVPARHAHGAVIQSIVSGVPIGELGQLDDFRVGHADAAVGRMSGDQPRLVGAVDADDSAAGPIGLDVRQRRGAERHRPVDAADREPAEPIADVELSVRGGRARLAGAHVRKEDDLAVEIQGERGLLGRNHEVGMDRLGRSKRPLGDPADLPGGPQRQADLDPPEAVDEHSLLLEQQLTRAVLRGQPEVPQHPRVP